MRFFEFAKKFEKYSIYFSEINLACQYLLKHSPNASSSREYLNSRISKENQEKFLFGYFPEDENLQELCDLVSEDKLKKLGLIYPNNDIRISFNKGILNSHNLIAPYQDIYGNIIGFFGRTFLDEEKRKELKLQKYKYTQFHKSLHLFGLYQAKEEILKNNNVYIVEGQIDCITCNEYGINNVIALGGVALSDYQFYLLRRLTDNITFLLDGDKEGREAQEKLTNKYKNLINIKNIELPNGYKDIDTYLRATKDITLFC